MLRRVARKAQRLEGEAKRRHHDGAATDPEQAGKRASNEASRGEAHDQRQISQKVLHAALQTRPPPKGKDACRPRGSLSWQPVLALQCNLRRLAALFGERLVWGSDWPHTSFAADALPAYGSTWAPVVAALGEARAARLRTAGARLYGSVGPGGGHPAR